MNDGMTKSNAQRIISQLLNAPVAPGVYSHFINAGTEKVLDVLEEEYFKIDLAEGISCFKYLEGDYGTGKTQFINCLAERARRKDIVSSIVTIGQECPFNSPLSIYKSVMSSFLPPSISDEGIGIEMLFQGWLRKKLRESGIESGQEVPDMVRTQIERVFKELWLGAPDSQTAGALSALGLRLLALECGASSSVTDRELITWIRGDNIRSRTLRESYGLHEPTREETAFKRLKTTIAFLRFRMGYRGFFVAFAEGTRTASFRRGSVQQKQAIENMLTMINENAEGGFGSVMFLYAATPDFRSDVIKTYIALYDRIGTVAFIPGQPMTPLIVLEKLNSDEVLKKIGEKLMDVFKQTSLFDWDRQIQRDNIETIIQAEKNVGFFLNTVPPRNFVYHYCRFLKEQESGQRKINLKDAESFIQSFKLPDSEEGNE